MKSRREVHRAVPSEYFFAFFISVSFAGAVFSYLFFIFLGLHTHTPYMCVCVCEWFANFSVPRFFCQMKTIRSVRLVRKVVFYWVVEVVATLSSTGRTSSRREKSQADAHEGNVGLSSWGSENTLW